MNSTSAEMQYYKQRIAPAGALLLSVIISGASQIYNGEVGKGVGMIIAYLLCVAASGLVFPTVILIGLWIWCMVDANTVAKEFNDALRKRLDNETVSLRETAAQQQHVKATMITAQEFVAQIDKYAKLFQSSLLSQAEFEGKKKEMTLTAKNLAEALGDLLTAIIPLIQKKLLQSRNLHSSRWLFFKQGCVCWGSALH